LHKTLSEMWIACANLQTIDLDAFSLMSVFYAHYAN